MSHTPRPTHESFERFKKTLGLGPDEKIPAMTLEQKAVLMRHVGLLDDAALSEEERARYASLRP